jgi:hypothetical protein
MLSQLAHVIQGPRLSILTVGLLIFSGAAQAQINACDLNGDGAVNVVDVQLAVDMYLHQLPCPTNINGGVCDTALVNQVVAATLGGVCAATFTHTVSLSWTASTSAGVTGYNVYRAAISGGPYAKVNSSLVIGTTYSDSIVPAGKTYFYVATAVDNSNNESAYSIPAQAVVPSP